MQQQFRLTGTIPDIELAPELMIGLEMFLSMFYDLESCRSFNFGIGPITWLTINVYCESNNFDEIQKEKAHIFIPALDRVYRNFCNESKGINVNNAENTSKESSESEE